MEEEVDQNGRREGVGGRNESFGSGGETEEVKRAVLGRGVKQEREGRSDGGDIWSPSKSLRQF